MRASDHTGDASVLFLKMQPSWMVIDDIRRFVATFCASACPWAERDEQLALATHELIQNAISNAVTADIELTLEVDRGRERVEVAVTNDARPDQIDVLRSRLDKAQSHPDPLEAYVEAMREDPHSRGGIGLARIRFEAALDLALEVDGDRVTIRAAGPLAAPEPAQAA
jgi:anti-sigma regulatory factor (Ser/Thr protein kinase)